MKKLIPLLLALCLTLSGCFLGDGPLFPVPTQPSDFDDITHFSDMVYQRPDMDALGDSMYHAVELAEDEADPDDILDAILAFYNAYDAFYTQYALADIHYSADLTDTYWETEYDFCSQAANTAPDAFANRAEILTPVVVHGVVQLIHISYSPGSSMNR